MTEVTHTLAASLPDGFDRTGTVYVGILHPLAQRIPDEHKALGIQTEHYYDAHGRQMTTYKWQGRRQRIVDPYDNVLDFSLANKRAYDPLNGSFHFGPWVFPEEEFEYVPGDGPPVFFGSTTERRERILRDISASTEVQVVPPGTYGDRLAKEIATARAIINIHREEGSYAEVPRVLSAYRAGKVLISEPLAEPFIAGKHYIPHDDPEGSDPREVFRNLSELAKEYRFSDLLRGKCPVVPL